jgi:aromatic ring hydroxylase
MAIHTEEDYRNPKTGKYMEKYYKGRVVACQRRIKCVL